MENKYIVMLKLKAGLQTLWIFICSSYEFSLI